MSHIPVLLQPTIDLLDPHPGDFFIDGTLGAGGHAREIIKRISPKGRFLGVDRDKGAVDKFLSDEDSEIIIRNANFDEIPEIIKKEGLGKADGLLLDLGMSSEQIDGSLAGRGFTFQKNEPLLMTFDDNSIPAKDIIKQLDEKELTEVLQKYGEETYARKIAQSIKKSKEMETTMDLVRAVEKIISRRGKLHPATKTFMGLRIYVNKELEHIENILQNLKEILAPGGRVVIISFHALEDGLVKTYFKKYSRRTVSGEIHLKVVTEKPNKPSNQEILNNPRSRSAKLRAAIVL